MIFSLTYNHLVEVWDLFWLLNLRKVSSKMRSWNSWTGIPWFVLLGVLLKCNIYLVFCKGKFRCVVRLRRFNGTLSDRIITLFQQASHEVVSYAMRHLWVVLQNYTALQSLATRSVKSYHWVTTWQFLWLLSGIAICDHVTTTGWL